MYTNKISGLLCNLLPRFAWFCAKLELKIRFTQVSTSSSLVLGTNSLGDVQPYYVFPRKRNHSVVATIGPKHH